MFTSLHFSNDILLTYTAVSGCHGKQLILEPKGTLGTVIMSDNTPAKVVVVWLCHYIINLHSTKIIVQSQC